MTTPTFLSEIFPLTISNTNLISFRLTPEIDREIGNRLSFHFCRKFSNLVVVWLDKYFWVLGTPTRQMPDTQEWKAALNSIREEIEDFNHSYWSFQWLHQPVATPQVLAQLAYQILRIHRPFKAVPVLSEQGVEVRREAEVWPETIDLEDTTQLAIAITIRSRILFRGTLAEFYENHPYRNNPQTILVGLKVQEIEKGSFGTIAHLIGTVGEHRDELLEKKPGSVSAEALINAPDEQPLVAVQFKNHKIQYHYAMAALRPSIGASMAEQLGIDYGKFLKKTKIPDQERQNLLKAYKKQADDVLVSYGFKFANKCFNSSQYANLFWQPSVPLSETLLLFGKGFTGVQSKILTGLRQGGVYKRHNDFRDLSTPIRIAALKLCDCKVNPFLKEVQQRLSDYKFNSEVVNQIPILTQNSSNASVRVEVERAVNEILTITADIVLVFLPENDRYADNTAEGSFYHQIYSSLLNRRVASQFIYDDTLKDTQISYILNQVIPGILAKLGNLPFVLAEPLEIADYFIGLDVSRKPKENLSGTLNACASVRLYGKHGEFLNYRLEGDLIEGEEIPLRFLEKILPESTIGGKTVLIYRDGYFINREVENLLARASAIKARFILVECRKNHIPRLYNLEDRAITAPTQGLRLYLSSWEAIVVTTQVPENLGLARPLRLRILEEGYPASIESVIDTTLKLTLLHHGALKIPRLPMPIYGADRMANLRLKGIYPSILEGDRQFWL